MGNGHKGHHSCEQSSLASCRANVVLLEMTWYAGDDSLAGDEGVQALRGHVSDGSLPQQQAAELMEGVQQAFGLVKFGVFVDPCDVSNGASRFFSWNGSCESEDVNFL